MTPANIELDPAFPVMVMDMLNNVLSRAGHPGEFGQYVTEEVRELTGARAVVLIQWLNDQPGAPYRVVSVNPERQRKAIESVNLPSLIPGLRELESPLQLRQEKDAETLRLLGQPNVGVCLVIPLRVGNSCIGSLLVMGVGDDYHTPSVVALLSRLSTVIALVLGNTLLYEEQERLIREGSSQLQVSNEALTKSHQDFERLINTVDGIVWEADAQTLQFTFVSAQAEKFLGYPRKAWMEETDFWLNHLHPEDRAWAPDFCMKAATEGRNHQFEYRMIAADKRVVWLRDVVTVEMKNGLPCKIQGIMMDVTEAKHIEAQYLRSQRLESVGRLAGGIAHDLNNILSPILMSVPFLREEHLSAEALTLLDTIEASAQRGAGIVKQVLTFTRGIKGEKTPLQLRHLVKEMAQIIQETFPKSIALRTDMPTNLWQIVGDATQLHQILLNLSVNARDAMPDGGTMVISTENVELDEVFTGMVGQVQPGHYVRLTVTDTGTGIPPEHLDKIFDPFFTTKAPDKGTGLGLATVLGIVRSHNGAIQVLSKPGHTQFKIYLPAFPTAVETNVTPPVEACPSGNGELILVIDDEEVLRTVTLGALQNYGYRTLSASDGTDGITLFAQHRNEIRVVITDLMMPHMDGPTTIRVLRKIDPGVKIVATSGLESHPMLNDLKGLNVHGFLKKPFTVPNLLNALHLALQTNVLPEEAPPQTKGQPV